jgi:sugar phosphate isomerase/epimerase
MRPALHFGMCGSDVEATIRFLQDVDIRDLTGDVNQIPGRREKGRLTAEDLRAFSGPLQKAGIALSAVTAGWVKRDDAGAPAAGELETICHDIGVLGGGGVPVVQLFDMGTIPEGADRARYYDGLYRSYREVTGACAKAGVKLAIHAGWVPDHALWNTATFLDLFAAVPDASNGVCFCAGSYYQSGDDVLDSARRLGERIHLVHFRDAETIGTNCPELLLGRGNVPFAGLARVLHETGYAGVVQCEHFGKLRCEAEGAATAAWGAGFLRGLLQAR